MSNSNGSRPVGKMILGGIFGFILGAFTGTIFIPYAGTILGGIVGAYLFGWAFSNGN